ncbi:hypothetical protein K1719_042772 [Acacia pycnantha]|nr:hypothetical protein K1719_042772 [Acacia pycnantha]
MNSIALTLEVIFYGYFSFVLRQLFKMRARKKDPSLSIEGMQLLFLVLAHHCSVVYGPHPVKNLVGHIALWHLFYLRNSMVHLSYSFLELWHEAMSYVMHDVSSLQSDDCKLL